MSDPSPDTLANTSDPSPAPSPTIALTRALLHLKMHRNALEQAIWAMRKNIEFAGVKDEAALTFGIRASLFALREFDDDAAFQAAVSAVLEPASEPASEPESTPSPSLAQQNSRESMHQPSASQSTYLP